MKRRMLCVVMALLMLVSFGALAENDDGTAEALPQYVPTDNISEGEELLEVDAELSGVLQWGDIEGEQFSRDFLDEIGMYAVTTFDDADDDGSLTNAKIATFIERMRSAILNLEPSISLSDLNIAYNGSVNTAGSNLSILSKYASIVLNSTPESFVCTSGMSYTMSSAKIASMSIGLSSSAATMRADYDAEVKAALKELFPNGTGDMTKAEIALAVHDYIVLHTRYDHEQTNSNRFSAYGALVNGLAVCQGYSMLYIDLLEEMGIESYFVSSSALNHGWNIVKTEAGWHHVDVTWDDPTISETTGDYDRMGFCRHTYFLNTQSEFKESHAGSSGTYDATISVYGSTPIVSSNAHPNSAFWQDILGGMIYADGRWYYNNSVYSKAVTANSTTVYYTCGSVCSSKYGTERADTLVASNASNIVYANGCIVYAQYNSNGTNAQSICQYETASGKYMTAKELDTGIIISEIGAGRLNFDNSIVKRGTVIYADQYGNTETVEIGGIYISGDVNMDGSLGISDIKLICKYLVGDAKLDQNAAAAADVDENGTVDIADAIRLCKLVAKGEE